MNVSKIFESRLNLLFDFYETFRFHAENRMNLLEYTQSTNPNPSEQVELENLRTLVKDAETLFPHVIPLQNFKRELQNNHILKNKLFELQNGGETISHEDLIMRLLKITDEHS